MAYRSRLAKDAERPFSEASLATTQILLIKQVTTVLGVDTVRDQSPDY
jgi:hypothetical protein